MPVYHRPDDQTGWLWWLNRPISIGDKLAIFIGSAIGLRC